VLKLLEVLATQGPINRSSPQWARILVPDFNGIFWRIDSNKVFYDDSNRSDDAQRQGYGIPAHPGLSRALALSISLPFLSTLELGDEEEEDGDDYMNMGEDLCVRISDVLKSYDINYALNEFLANAADAGASRFAMLLDNRPFQSGRLLTPQMEQFQHGPSIFLYNDAKFSDTDFTGLRKVGQGGKMSQSDTIGRFGLGALSLFHFTEV
jgi:hypothetical protein